MQQKIISTAKSAGKEILKFRLHWVSKHQAKKILKSIEQEKGKTAPHLLKLSEEYAKDVLGWRGYAPWLKVYSAVAETFNEGWVPDNYYGMVVVPAIQGDYGRVSFLNSITGKIFDCPEIPNIGYYANGLFLSKDYSILNTKEFKDLLFKISEKVVFKTDHSYQGKGVFLFDKTSFDPLKMKLLGNGVFQDFIAQHRFFDTLTPDSVATLRITTVIELNGKTSVRACYLRLGRRAETHVKSGTHIRIPIDPVTGELGTFGYLPDWQTIEKHPDSLVEFANNSIPGFNSCLATAIRMHKQIPFVQAIGWDMTIDKNDNVKVMEWNGAFNDIKFSEATQGPCFSGLGWENLWKKQK